MAPQLVWNICDLVTGRILTELPLSAPTEITSVAMRQDSTTFTLGVEDDRVPDDWATLVVQGRTMVVLTVDGWPAQAWALDDVVLGGDEVELPATTLECCLSRTNVPDLDSDLDSGDAMAVLCAPVVTRFGFTIEHDPTGTVNSYTYSNLEDRSIQYALDEERKGGGPEYRVTVRWGDTTKSWFEKVLEIRPHIGSDRPDAVFDLDTDRRGNVESYTRSASFAAGNGATMLIGVSDGAGTTRVMTDPQYSTLVDAGYPVWEERVTYTGLPYSDSSTDEDAAMLAWTQEQLTQKQGGSRSCTVVGDDNAPVPGRDYQHGDTIHVDIKPQGKRDPFGWIGAVRVLGWKLDTASGRSTPIVWDENGGVGS